MRNRYSSSVMVIVDNWKFINDHVHIRCTWTNSLFFCMYVHMDQLLKWKFDQERALSTADMNIVLLRNFLLWIAARPWLQTGHGKNSLHRRTPSPKEIFGVVVVIMFSSNHPSSKIGCSDRIALHDFCGPLKQIILFLGVGVEHQLRLEIQLGFYGD